MHVVLLSPMDHRRLQCQEPVPGGYHGICSTFSTDRSVCPDSPYLLNIQYEHDFDTIVFITMICWKVKCRS